MALSYLDLVKKHLPCWHRAHALGHPIFLAAWSFKRLLFFHAAEI